MSHSTPLQKARAAWGDALPEWVEGLARVCGETSQNKVAKRMDVSAALISNVLANKYPGDMQRIEDIYRGLYERAVVTCPALGELSLNECRNWRKRYHSFRGANAMGVQMFRACRRCPLNTGGGNDT